MKRCSYCGRKNQDEFVNCFECGTDLPAITKGDHSAAPPLPLTGEQVLVRSYTWLACFCVIVEMNALLRFFESKPLDPAYGALFLWGLGLVTGIVSSIRVIKFRKSPSDFIAALVLVLQILMVVFFISLMGRMTEG
ncbi:MAG: hypothetical protein JWQ71_4833 [Pedosphaera sp.]|nr:hypothetical protein [Pedosphaera sp.]